MLDRGPQRARIGDKPMPPPRKMDATLSFKVLAAWLVILVAAVANGLVREKLLLPWLGSFGALVVSGLVLVAIIFLVAYF